MLLRHVIGAAETLIEVTEVRFDGREDPYPEGKTLHYTKPDGVRGFVTGVNFSIGEYAEVYVEVTAGVVKIDGHELTTPPDERYDLSVLKHGY